MIASQIDPGARNAQKTPAASPPAGVTVSANGETAVNSEK
jgi:hypothetical protein